MGKKKIGFMAIILGLILTACSDKESGVFEVPFDGQLSHVHGMGYAGNDGGLYFASHIGLKIYRDGEWFETSDNVYDYMGFNAVDKGFYTSGHPSADSDLPNPLGIQRSFDAGKSLDSIAFEGETDYHAMAVGYNSHDIFLLNPEGNSILEPGFHISKDEGETWEAVNVEGLEGEVSALALHPTDSSLVAAATSSGIYLSENGGGKFSRITNNSEQGTAVFFNKNALFYASYDKSPSLIKYTVEDKEQEILNLPDLTEDGIAFIFQNPNKTEEVALYTIQGKAFLSEDATNTWYPLLKDGTVQ
jgi:hypothetical protein